MGVFRWRAFSEKGGCLKIAQFMVIRRVFDLETAPLLMFAEEDLPRYVPDAEGARNKLQGMLEKMRAAASWPWKDSTVSLYRDSVWPSLLGKIAEREAARLRSEIEAEIARLDAAA